MSLPPYKAAGYNDRAFNCPHCYAYAEQLWRDLVYFEPSIPRTSQNPGNIGVRLARCTHCTRFSVWFDGQQIYPDTNVAPPPNVDLPEEVKADYGEASNILSKSPRGAAALLRLAIQKLCRSLGESGENLNGDIASLVKKGLPTTVQQALDSVRVIGNNAVHPGQIDLRDDPAMANGLFELINIICDYMISQPKRVASIYAKLPENLRQAIEKRDN